MKVFISYSTKDIDYATTVKDLLDSIDMQVFLAEYSMLPGQRFDELIPIIRQSQVLLLIWSENAKESDWVRDEVGVALGAGRLVLPVALDSHTPLPAFLRGTKYVAAQQSKSASLPAIQRVILKWRSWLDERHQQAEEQQRVDDFWKLSVGALALVGGIAILDALTSSDNLKTDLE